jgi:hypothetical protein
MDLLAFVDDCWGLWAIAGIYSGCFGVDACLVG